MMSQCNLLNANSISRLGLKLKYMSNLKLTIKIEVPFSNEPDSSEKFIFLRSVRIHLNITIPHEAQYAQKLSDTFYFSRQHKLKPT